MKREKSKGKSQKCKGSLEGALTHCFCVPAMWWERTYY
jgi:hypothetical protein